MPSSKSPTPKLKVHPGVLPTISRLAAFSWPSSTGGSVADPSIAQRHHEIQERQAVLIAAGILVRCEGDSCGRAFPVEKVHRFEHGDKEVKLCMKCCPRCEP